jgi:hypothetical protein
MTQSKLLWKVIGLEILVIFWFLVNGAYVSMTHPTTHYLQFLGIVALTKSVAQEYGHQNIRINSFCPGAFRTPMLEERFSDLSSEEKAKLNESYQKLNALGRIGDPLEAAKAVKWLLSDDASFVTGQNIIVDGGIGFRFE